MKLFSELTRTSNVHEAAARARYADLLMGRWEDWADLVRALNPRATRCTYILPRAAQSDYWRERWERYCAPRKIEMERGYLHHQDGSRVFTSVTTTAMNPVFLDWREFVFEMCYELIEGRFYGDPNAASWPCEAILIDLPFYLPTLDDIPVALTKEAVIFGDTQKYVGNYAEAVRDMTLQIMDRIQHRYGDRVAAIPNFGHVNYLAREDGYCNVIRDRAKHLYAEVCWEHGKMTSAQFKARFDIVTGLADKGKTVYLGYSDPAGANRLTAAAAALLVDRPQFVHGYMTAGEGSSEPVDRWNFNWLYRVAEHRLGMAQGNRPESTMMPDVWRRDYEEGAVFFNAGTVVQMILLAPGERLLSNEGRLYKVHETSITLRPGEGTVVVRI